MANLLYIAVLIDNQSEKMSYLVDEGFLKVFSAMYQCSEASISIYQHNVVHTNISVGNVCAIDSLTNDRTNQNLLFLGLFTFAQMVSMAFFGARWRQGSLTPCSTGPKRH